MRHPLSVHGLECIAGAVAPVEQGEEIMIHAVWRRMRFDAIDEKKIELPAGYATESFWHIPFMPTIIYIDSNGDRQQVEVENGYTVMEGAINNSVAGIVAECGGACACATCHSYISEGWLQKLEPMDDMEDAMLDAAYERRDNSRLTCQIEVTDELDGMVVHVAEND